MSSFKFIRSDAVLVIQSDHLAAYGNRDLLGRLGAEVNAHGDMHALEIFLLNTFFPQTFEKFDFFGLAGNDTDIGGIRPDHRFHAFIVKFIALGHDGDKRIGVNGHPGQLFGMITNNDLVRVREPFFIGKGLAVVNDGHLKPEHFSDR